MGLSASQGRMLLLTARKSDLEFRAQQISQRRLILSQQLEDIALEYEAATSNRKMKIGLYEINAQDSTGAVTKTDNLTYKNLVSGCMALSSDVAGIQASTTVGTAGLQYASTSAYRLVDPEGRIVVSDVSEIPKTITEEKSEEASVSQASKYSDNAANILVSTVTTMNGKEDQNPQVEKRYFYKLPTEKIITEGEGDDAKQTDTIAKFLESKNMNDYEFSFDENGVIRVKSKEDGTSTYFNQADGKKIDPPQTFSQVKDAVLEIKDNDESIPESKTVINYTETESRELRDCGNGKYELVDENGKIEGTYFVDSTLKTGSFIEGEGASGPNYLQDCLRNGKYAIQKYNNNAEEENRKWTNISWDSAANIGDEYYTDDDEKAKTRYDRLQNQIQNQDKKLELELDNIETQRSAVTTEEESVKKVIDENIEGSFNAFA